MLYLMGVIHRGALGSRLPTVFDAAAPPAIISRAVLKMTGVVPDVAGAVLSTASCCDVAQALNQSLVGIRNDLCIRHRGQ